MIEISQGNLLTADAEALVNTVNTDGFMGKGIALQFARAFPEMLRAYEAACRSGELAPGRVQVFERGDLVNPRFIINFPTKRHWRGKSLLADIDSGLIDLVRVVRERGIRSIAVPPLGCGLGGLQWGDVRPRIEAAFAALPDVRLQLYVPQQAPAPEARPIRTEAPQLTPARARVIEVLAAYLALGYELSLLEVHKLLYFLQIAGEELKLRYRKHAYGPYADNLRQVLNRFEGHYTRGYDGDDKPDTEIALLPGAREAADAFLSEARQGSSTDERLDRVVKLIEGFESPYGMELLATVHWVAANEAPPAGTLDEAVQRVHEWTARKQRTMPRDHIELAWNRLQELGWITPLPAPEKVVAAVDEPASEADSGRYANFDRQQLIRLLERRDAERQLGLVWERDEIEADRALNDDFVALELDESLSHGAAPWNNLIIEGDNFDALRYLRMTHAGRIRCIYIDPPYNTGNRDFVYNDRFVDKTHRFRHSLWLEFMYRRLTLARDLLADDGVIFVSIDDNEIFRLGMLMDRVFGEENWIQTLIWKKSYGGGAKAKHVVGLHEYVLCFARQKALIERIELPPDPKVLRYYKYRDDKFDRRGPYRLQPLATNSMDARANLRYSIPYKDEEIWPAKQWQWQRDRALSALENNELAITGEPGNWTVNYKQYLRDEDGKERGSKPYSVFEGPYTQVGTGEVRDIFGDGKAFSFPKPSGLIANLVAFLPKDSIVLDFFAGSGTTAHAVAKLNAEDGGSRRFVLVSNTEASEDQPNKNLCRDVCAERVRRVMGGYTNAKGEVVAGLGGNFAYLRARRVAKHRLARRLGHAEVWNALQLIHDLPLQPPESGALRTRNDAALALAYLPEWRESAVAALRTWCGEREQARVVVYSWTPARLRELPNGVDLRPIPESLRLRFGGTRA